MFLITQQSPGYNRHLFVSLSVKLPEYVHPPPGHSCEEPWAKVSCRVDWIAAVQTHGHSDGQDDQADAQWLHALWSTDILPVSDGQDTQDQRGSCNYLENKSIRQLVSYIQLQLHSQHSRLQQ